MKSHYETLGVSEDATPEEIKEAYRDLSKKWHPDKHQDSSKKEEIDRMQSEINEAYSVLSDPQKRANYDEYGTDINPVSIEDSAGERIKSLFKEIIIQHNTTQMFSLAHQTQELIIKEIKSNLEKEESRIDLFETNISKLQILIDEKVEDGMDHLRSAIDELIKEFRLNIAGINIDATKTELIISEKALEILEEHYPGEEDIETTFSNTPPRDYLDRETFLKQKSILETFISIPKSKNFWT